MVNCKVAPSCGREETVPETKDYAKAQATGAEGLTRSLPVERGFLAAIASAGPKELCTAAAESLGSQSRWLQARPQIVLASKSIGGARAP
jgi:hypothetical protein